MTEAVVTRNCLSLAGGQVRARARTVVSARGAPVMLNDLPHPRAVRGQEGALAFRPRGSRRKARRFDRVIQKDRYFVALYFTKIDIRYEGCTERTV